MNQKSPSVQERIEELNNVITFLKSQERIFEGVVKLQEEESKNISDWVAAMDRSSMKPNNKRDLVAEYKKLTVSTSGKLEGVRQMISDYTKALENMNAATKARKQD